MSHKCEICDKENWHDLDRLRNRDFWFDLIVKVLFKPDASMTFERRRDNSITETRIC